MTNCILILLLALSLGCSSEVSELPAARARAPLPLAQTFERAPLPLAQTFARAPLPLVETFAANCGECDLSTEGDFHTFSGLLMETDPWAAPYYFWYWHPLAYPPDSARYEIRVTARMAPGVRTFGWGMHLVTGGQFAILFARLNFDRGLVEVLVQTTPHVWADGPAIPAGVGRDFLPVSLAMWTRTFGVDSLAINGIVFPVALSHVPTPNLDYPFGKATIKINPMGYPGIVGVAMLDSLGVSLR